MPLYKDVVAKIQKLWRAWRRRKLPEPSSAQSRDRHIYEDIYDEYRRQGATLWRGEGSHEWHCRGLSALHPRVFIVGDSSQFHARENIPIENSMASSRRSVDSGYGDSEWSLPPPLESISSHGRLSLDSMPPLE
ncbi:uncharacterized protein STEHIDRAFT_160961 [Stereum hirsutum FP-91666 SS1]|uniref:uncharacterized protein n=1 Tax=Stereum hirsutum (strain FP-91666) TaxID=721885 RepID=UPI000444994C|nr:uncharacterized protein STEHIDRAFT_160961 [Stereum hirsutum FP-91666 SS1]EIM82416.1 hypothetical protein STEHIDRAFT_160961 [Stereum hirsutum FP-91666 SS1]